ncbi:MAG: M28 family peptidase [Elusimicrobia bacterium]|nr:M28 family peptidase [Elusimicrobiota bacterium]
MLALNVALFIAVTSSPAFAAAHHHWIFPALAVLLGVQWALTFAFARAEPFFSALAARAAVLFSLGFLLVMGILRHASILTCFDQCRLKLAAAALVAAPVFWAHRWTQDEGFWNPLRAGLAGLGAALWALYLALRGVELAPYAVNLAFAVLGLGFWLGRDRPLFLMTALGIGAGLAIRATGNEFAIMGLGVLAGVVLPLAAVPDVGVWLARRAPAGPPPPASPWRRAAQAAAFGAAFLALAFFVVGPTFLMTNPETRREHLTRLAPKPIEGRKLSPLAQALRRHVRVLAKDIGERDVYHRPKQEKARDYVIARLKAAGYPAKELAYGARGMGGFKEGTPFYNVEAVLARTPADPGPIWVLGAHYDSAPGTPGADDNASGVAVLIELARLLRGTKVSREIRFVAFGTEEPPAFGTQNMGSYRYAERLKENGVQVHGMISLEMLGYYNPARGAQLYPPFLHLVNPDHGDFIGVCANVASRALMSEFALGWGQGAGLPLTTAILPGPFSSLALSDQLNFWDRGYPAVLLSDTAFFRNPNYHQESDLPETLDYEKMARVTRALVRVLSRP